MMGLSAATQQQALFSYHVNLEQRIPGDHQIRKLHAALDLDFVIPAVRNFYGRSGHVSLDPRVLVKLMILLFYFNIPSERELMEQLPVRLDFLWFLGFDLETSIPDHSVLSKARARWGTAVFQKLFVRTVKQCVRAGLVDGRLLHTDSTMVKANASKASVLETSPELVSALRQAYQELEDKLQVLPTPQGDEPKAMPATAAPVGASAGPQLASTDLPAVTPQRDSAVPESTPPQPEPTSVAIQVLPTAPEVKAESQPKASGKKLPVNSTHISKTDPLAQLSRSKNGLTDLNYKEHRMVDDAHGVITALSVTDSNVPDGTQLPGLAGQHQQTTGLERADVTVAGDHHYGTASNYLFCAEQGIRAHLADVSANVQERGKFPQTQFIYDAATDRLRCPAGHHLVFHQHRPEEMLKVYLIEDRTLCANCPLRSQCTAAKQGRSIRRHVQAQQISALLQEAKSPEARHSRKRRQHVMEGSFADAANNHGSKRARWRGLGRQKIQSWMIAAMQNLRILIQKATGRGGNKAAAALVAAAQEAGERKGAKYCFKNQERPIFRCHGWAQALWVSFGFRRGVELSSF
jgi:transposase